MNKSFFTVLLLAVLMGFVSMSFVSSFVKADEAAAASDAEAAAGPTDVVDLTAASFDEIVSKSEFALIEFYAPWCPHCKRLVPEYEKAATALKDKNILVAKVDCDKEQGMAQRFEVQGFPTIKLFKNGKPFRDYDDERTADAMTRWTIKKTGPSVQSVATQAELDALIAKETADRTTGHTLVVGHFASKDSDARKAFAAAADSSDVEDFAFVELIAADAAQDGAVKLHRPFEPKQLAFEGKLAAADELVSFVKQNGYPLVDEINGKTFRRFAESNLPLAIAFFDFEDKKTMESVIDVLTSAAEQVKGKLSFGYSDGKAYAQQLEIMGGDAKKLPGLAAMNIQKRQNFPFPADQELTVDNVVSWASGIASGDVKPHMRSEPVPETNDAPVKVVVGKSYADIVLDDSKDVLLEVYAPWCGHCKKLAPIYDELATALAPAKNVVIAKLDGTLNDTPLTVEGFPTLYFFPAGKKDSPIEYQGSRSLKDLKKFIQKHASDASKADVDAVLKAGKKKKKAAKKEEPKKDEL